MYQPFIGRKEELSALEKLYETEGFQMMIVYGRRRIGKSTLLSHFIRGKKLSFTRRPAMVSNGIYNS